jgi:anti-anti-sigma regulatory factor
VGFIDSAGASALLHADQVARASQRRIALVGAAPRLRGVLESFGLTSLLADSRPPGAADDEARAAAAGAGAHPRPKEQP